MFILISKAKFNIKFLLKKISSYNYNLLAILSILFFIKQYFFKGIDKFVITPFSLHQVTKSISLDILSLLIIIWIVWRIYKIVCVKHQKLSYNSWLTIFLLVIFYLVVIRFSEGFILEPLSSIPKLKYLDILFLLFLFGVTKFQYYGDQGKFVSLDGFIEDDFQEEGIDLLGRDKYAKRIALKILDTQPLNKAFVIAINSPWGFGKSGFLLLIERFLKIKEDSELQKVMVPLIENYNEIQRAQAYLNFKNTLVLRYNPWKNFDNKRTIQDFFEGLSVSLKEYDTQLARNIKAYGNYLSKIDDSTLSKIIEASINTFENKETLTNLFETINKSIERIQKKIIVFVDDIDRLTGDELIDILKLIRNTANFRNVFFIVAYDHNYVLNTIDKQNLISNKEEYLQKIVQLEITLPLLQRSSLLVFLTDKIKENELLRLHFDKIDTAINEISSILVLNKPALGSTESAKIEVSDYHFRTENKEDSLLFKIFRNIRDIIRFTNSFKLSFESIGSVADVYEIIMLEFLKIKYLSIYQLIANKDRNFLKFSNSKYWFDEDSFKIFIKEGYLNKLNKKETEVEVIKTILVEIFNSSRKTFFRSVGYPRYFEIYFTYQAPTLTSLEKIESSLKKNIEDVIEIIDEAYEQNTLIDLKSFLVSQLDFSGKDDFEIMLKTLFYIAKYDPVEKPETIYQIKELLQNRDIVKNFYNENEEELSTVLLSILQDERYYLKTRMEIAAEELYKIVSRISHENTIILIHDKSALQEIVFSCFKQIMDDKVVFDGTINSLYLKNLAEIEENTREIKITKKANELMKDFITDHPNEYLKKFFLREHPEPPPPFQKEEVSRYYHLDPFLLHYFGDWNSVMSLLGSEYVKNLFSVDEDEKRFYEVLFSAIDRSKENNIKKFLITDRETINLINKFITVKHFKS